MSIRPTVSETADVLNKVLNNNKEAAHLLAKALHEEVSMDVGSKVTNLTLQLDLSNIGIWIDPIGKKKKEFVIDLVNGLIFLYRAKLCGFGLV